LDERGKGGGTTPSPLKVPHRPKADGGAQSLSSWIASDKNTRAPPSVGDQPSIGDHGCDCCFRMLGLEGVGMDDGRPLACWENLPPEQPVRLLRARTTNGFAATAPNGEALDIERRVKEGLG
jgi:hypothetical protein